MSEKTFVDKVTIMMRHYREAAGLSQSDVAEALKIGLRSYQRYESGETIPTIDILYLLSKVLNFEMAELIAPEDQKAKLENFKIFKPEEAQFFLNDPMVKDSRLAEIYDSPEFKKVIATGEPEHMRENALFMNSEYPLAISQPKHSFINKAAQKITGLQNDLVPTAHGHDDLRKLGLTWGIVMNKNHCFIEDLTYPDFPKGKAQMRVKGIYTRQDGNYILLSLAHIVIDRRSKK